MFGVKLNELHSFDDLGLVFVTRRIGSPAPQVKTVSVPMRNGSIDMTEVLTGDVRYENRQIKIKFRTFEKYNNRHSVMDRIMNAYHGKNTKIIFDDDPAHFYYGRCTVGTLTPNGAAGDFEMVFDCKPFKYDITDTGMDGGSL